MFWPSGDDIVHKEIEGVRARRIILDQLEGGPRTGSELRESIRKDMAARQVSSKGKKIDPKKVKVTDPKLYFNTQRLEDLRIIRSWRESQQRVFSLEPKAVHPVRRALGIAKPKVLLTALALPEDARPLVAWLSTENSPDIKLLRLIVEQQRFARGVSKNLEKHIPDNAPRQWESRWFELPAEIAGDNEGRLRGNLMSTYAEIEKVVLEDIPERDILVDLSSGPPTIVLALSLLAMEYSLPAIHVQKYEGEKTIITSVLPRRESARV
jgi:hypothetical protein